MAWFYLHWCMLVATLLSPPQAVVRQNADQFNGSFVTTLLRQNSNAYVLDAPVVTYRFSKQAGVLDGWSEALGVSLTEVDEPLRVQLRLAPSEGALITSVNQDGAAAKARIQRHDVILGLPATVEFQQPLKLTAVRAGERLRINLDLTPAKQYWIGVNTNDLDDAMRTQLSLPSGRGILIAEVIDRTPAQQAGLLKYDVVLGLADGTAVNNTGDLSKMVQSSDGKTLQLQILRHAKSMTVGVTPIERPREENQQKAVYQGLNWIRSHDANATAAWTNLAPATVDGSWATTSQPQLVWSYVLNHKSNPQDAAAKIEGLEKQVRQLLQEVSALRQTIEKQKATDVNAPKK